MRVPPAPEPGPPATHVLTILGLLWLTGVSMRVTVMAVPPVIPRIHDDLHLTETQVGLLIGLPLLTWALAAIPGSLSIARLGASRTLMLGLLATGLAGAGRAAVPDVWLLYLATLLMGSGIAIMQPSVQTLVREWLPQRIGLATAVATNGILIGAAAAPILTIPLVLPLVAQSWRLDLVVWALPALLTAILLALFAPRSQAPPVPPAPTSPSLPSPGGGLEEGGAGVARSSRWWPDWSNPLLWLLGFTFGSNNALYFGTAAFLPDYLASIGRADLTGAALGWMTGSQFVASALLLITAERVHRRVWPYLVFGLGTVVAVLGIAIGSGLWIVAAATLLGFSLAITFVITLALPPALSPPGEVHRMSAGMFTLSYSLAVIVPVVCGALWDLTAKPWTAFLPLGLCATALTVLGVALSLKHRG
jgi:MFS transporter, CP family, cyanate transporter